MERAGGELPWENHEALPCHNKISVQTVVMLLMGMTIMLVMVLMMIMGTEIGDTKQMHPSPASPDATVQSSLSV